MTNPNDRSDIHSGFSDTTANTNNQLFSIFGRYLYTICHPVRAGMTAVGTFTTAYHGLALLLCFYH